MWVAKLENGEEIREYENGTRLPFPNDFITGFKYAPHIVEVERNGLVKIDGRDLYVHLEIDGKSYTLLNVTDFRPFFRHNGAVGLNGEGYKTSVSMGYEGTINIKDTKINIIFEIEQGEKLLLKHTLLCNREINAILHCYFDKKLSIGIQAKAHEEIVTVKTLL